MISQDAFVYFSWYIMWIVWPWEKSSISEIQDFVLLSLQILFNAKVGRTAGKTDWKALYSLVLMAYEQCAQTPVFLYYLVATLSVLEVCVSVSGGLRPTSAPILPFFLRILMTRKGYCGCNPQESLRFCWTYREESDKIGYFWATIFKNRLIHDSLL